MSKTVATLPDYLRPYVSHQDYDRYTAQDHAVWRFIMRQSRAFFKAHAHPLYVEGLKKTGIPLDRIPRIEEMDQALDRMGWGAIAVRGFIPPAAFLEFQARKVLPIAVDMRTVGHIAYTPAPDIVHEAAGHAPIIADEGYRHFLTRFAAMAQKAIFSRADLDQYEAIRRLSDTKENPDCSPEEILEAENLLIATTARITFVSEAALVARLYWWTAEYGLMGTVDDYKLFGAGLLSSVGESQNVCSPGVKKVPLSIACVDMSYDITRPQPQLFVARDTAHLLSVLDELEATMSFKRGGSYGLATAKKAQTVVTVGLNSGVAVSGELVDYRLDAKGELAFLKLSGPSQISWDGRELPGHGPDYHASGYSTPLGRWRDAAERAPEEFSDQELKDLGIERGQRVSLAYESGFVLNGVVKDWQRRNGKIAVMAFEDATLKQDEEIFFRPEWGTFDVVFGSMATTVYGGAADKTTYKDLGSGVASTTPGRQSPHTTEEQELFKLYHRARELRRTTERGVKVEAMLETLCRNAAAYAGDDWLISLECVELGNQLLGLAHSDRPWLQEHIDRLRARQSQSEVGTAELIAKGLALAAVPD